MRKAKRYIMLLFCVAIGCTKISAQDLAADLKKMQEYYKNMDRFDAKVAIKAIPKGHSTPFFTQEAEMKQEKLNIYYKTGGLTMVTNDKYTVWINEMSKRVFIKEHVKNEFKSKRGDAIKLTDSNLDSLFATYDSTAYVGTSNGMKHYIVYDYDGDIVEADIYLDVKTYYLKKAAYTYNDDEARGGGSRAEIEYTQFNTSPTFAKATFAIGKYVKIEGKSVTLQPNYRGYELVIGQEPNAN